MTAEREEALLKKVAKGRPRGRVPSLSDPGEPALGRDPPASRYDFRLRRRRYWHLRVRNQMHATRGHEPLMRHWVPKRILPSCKKTHAPTGLRHRTQPQSRRSLWLGEGAKIR